MTTTDHTKPLLLVAVSPGRSALARDAFETSKALASDYRLAFLVPKDVEKIFASLGPVVRWRPQQIVGMTLAIRTLRRAVQRFRPDLVHAHGYGAAAVTTGTFPLRLARRTIVSLHDQISERELATRYVDNAFKRNVRRAGAFTCSYPTLARAFERRIALEPDSILAIPHHTPLGAGGAELARAPGRPGPIVGWNGPLRADRAWESAIDTIVELLRDLPSAKLDIAGTGGARTLVEAYARERRVAHVVSLLGDVSSATFLGGIDAFIGPRTIDAQPHALLEALCVGVPVVVANEGAIADALRPLPTGWLVEPGAAALADGVRALWDRVDAVWSEAAAQRPQALATYGSEAVVARWRALYAATIANATAAGES